jgi:hypothetical protein
VNQKQKIEKWQGEKQVQESEFGSDRKKLMKERPVLVVG